MRNIYYPTEGIAVWYFILIRMSLGCGRSYHEKLFSMINCFLIAVARPFNRIITVDLVVPDTTKSSMGVCHNMDSQLKSVPLPFIKKGKRSSSGTADANGYKLHLALDQLSYARLVWLMGALQAASFVEVFRRALSAYEIFEPDDLPEESGNDSDLAMSCVKNTDLEHLYIVITGRMKEQLDSERSAFGRTYKETVRRALCVLMQLVREREKLTAQLKKGTESNDLSNKQKMLALL